ncbi:immunoglobulin domain-containing protein [Opitutia bacterium ISCC 51]|nr:immunoglobulin domain-containing protein [Opitutae bacterium ISCC 51]QXD28782.1 immunoglobulin domain-containing protein [Opitutae bacterium ISCC 52]
MFSRLLYQVLRARARLAWTGMALMLLLQRTPIQWVLAELRFTMGPRMIQIFKWLASVGTVSTFYNTVTGATGELSISPDPGSTSGIENEYMVFAIQPYRAQILTYQLEGVIPSGLTVGLAQGIVSISGFPNVSGNFPVKLSVLSWENNPDYTPGSIFKDFVITLTPEPPEITEAPQSIQVPLGGTAELTVEVDDPENTTYQWQRNVGSNLNQFSNLSGETEAVYRVENATPAVNGAYRVQVRKNGLTETSPSVFLTVSQEENFDSWQFEKFGEEASSEDAQPESNPDKDAFVNAFEFLFDLDPQMPDSVQSPILSREVIQGTDYVVFTFPALIDFPNLDYSFERTDDLQNGPWIQLLHTLDGVLIETDENGTVLKLPSEEAAFIRMKVDTD